MVQARRFAFVFPLVAVLEAASLWRALGERTEFAAVAVAGTVAGVLWEVLDPRPLIDRLWIFAALWPVVAFISLLDGDLALSDEALPRLFAVLSVVMGLVIAQHFTTWPTLTPDERRQRTWRR